MTAGKIKLGVGTAPSTPEPGFAILYFKTDKLLYAKDDAGVETALSGGGGGPVGGDLAGTLPNPTVDAIQGVPVSAAAPANGQALVYNSGTLQWEPAAVPSTPLNPATLPEIATPFAPPAGNMYLYARNTDSKLYAKNDGFQVFGPMGVLLGDDSAIYVSAGGSPLGDGTLRNPVDSVQTALNIGFNGCIIVVGKGTFTNFGSLSFGGLTDVTIIGQGVGASVLDNNGFTPSISVTSAFTRLRLLNLSITSSASGIVLDGTGVGTGNFLSSFVMRNVSIASSSTPLYCAYVGGIDIDSVSAVGGGVVSFDTCTFERVASNFQAVAGSYRVAWNEASTDKPGVRSTMRFTGTRWEAGPLHLRDQPDVFFDDTCFVGGYIDTDLGLSVAGGLAPNVEFHGVCDYVYLPAGASGIPDTVVAQTWNFSGARLRSLVFTAALNIGIQAPAANPQTVLADHMRIPSGASVVTGANITLYMAGNQLDMAFNGFGVFAPGQWNFQFMGPPGASPAVLAWPGGLTTVAPPKQIIITTRGDISGVPTGMGNITTGLYTATGFTLYYAGAAGVNDFFDALAIF